MSFALDGMAAYKDWNNYLRDDTAQVRQKSPRHTHRHRATEVSCWSRGGVSLCVALAPGRRGVRVGGGGVGADQ